MEDDIVMRHKNDLQTPTRRKFLGTVGAATAATLAIGVKPFLGGNESVAEAADGNSSSPGRMNDCFNYRKNAALANRVSVGTQADNGDAERFTDFSGNYSKALLQSSRDIAEIAYQLNFHTASHFTQLFKKITGITPKEYRIQFFK